MDSAQYYRSISIKLWPPSQSTRLMLVERMIKNLTTPSKYILSRKYGLLHKKEAEDISKEIEALAYASANLHFKEKPDGDGSLAIQLYAKQCSKLMLEAIERDPLKAKEEGTMTRDTVFDISGGRRAFIDAEEAKELLKPLSEQGNKYTKICFSNRSFGYEAARIAEALLFSVKDQLVEVDLSDFIAGRPEDEALEVMKIFSSVLDGCKLRYLNLSNNALGKKGVKAFESLLKSQHNLEEFQCSSTRVDSKGGVALAEALGTCFNLKKLDLHDNMFGVKSGVALSKALPGCPNLSKLYLSYLNLADEGCIALANALRESATSLELLEMSGNKITAKASPSLASLITSQRSLSRLNLSKNELKDEGAIQIAKALEQDSVQLNEVDLSTNLIRRAGARALAQTVIAKPGFKLLNINANFISDDGVDEIKDIFKSSPAMLASLDDNDPEGEDYDTEADQAGDEDELESKLKGLNIKH